MLQSNAILADPKTPSELEDQFDALCRALGLDPESPGTLATLRDPARTPWQSVTKVIEEEKLGRHGTFRGCLAEDWIITSPGPMERQRNGSFAKGLREHGVQYVILGEVSEEWYLYSIAHTITSPSEFTPNLERYFAPDLVKRLIAGFPPLPEGATQDEIVKRFGDMLSCAQVYLPLRILARDLRKADFPFLRYEICWTPEQGRPLGYVTHGTDRALWALRLDSLTSDQVGIAESWLDRIDEEAKRIVEEEEQLPELSQALFLRKDREIGWDKDARWQELAQLGNRVLQEPK